MVVGMVNRMQKAVLNMKKNEQKNPLILGLTICLERIAKMKDYEDIENYLSYGILSSFDIKEEIARLLLLATTLPTEKSPTVDISEKLLENHIVDINSMFIKEFLELEERNKTNSFMKSDFYYKISNKLEEMEMKSLMDNSFYLNDSIILMKNIRNLYIANIDQNIEKGRLDVKYREPLIELFQYNLDNVHEKIRNGGKKNVQLQTRYQ